MKFCVIGLGRFGYYLASTLAQQGMEVLAIDQNEDIIAEIKDEVTQAICMKVTSEESLRAIGVDEMDTVIVAMGDDFSQSILITALLKKQLNIPSVIARSTSKIHGKILQLVGADRVVAPERDIGIRLARKLSFPFIDLMHVTETFAITQLQAPASFVGKTLGELALRKSRHVTCVGVKKGADIELVELNYVVLENDQMVFAGEKEDLESLARV